MITRRQLLTAPLLSRLGTGLAQKNARPKIAAVVTTYFKFSHAQHIVDRFLEGYGGTASTITRPWTWSRSTLTRSAMMISAATAPRASPR